MLPAVLHTRPGRHLRHLGWNGPGRQADRARAELRATNGRHQVGQPGIRNL